MSNARLLVFLVLILAPLMVKIAWQCVAGEFLGGYIIGLLAVPTMFILSLIVGIVCGLRRRLTDEFSRGSNEQSATRKLGTDHSC